MNDEIREILEKPNVYSFADETYLYFGDYNKLKYYITNLQQENDDLKNRLENAVADCNLRLQENEDYKSRVEKAVEYIKKDLSLGVNTFGSVYSIGANEVLNILQNGSDASVKD